MKRFVAVIIKKLRRRSSKKAQDEAGDKDNDVVSGFENRRSIEFSRSQLPPLPRPMPQPGNRASPEETGPVTSE